MPRNDVTTADQVCPGIRIHTIDIVQPPGMGTSPIAGMDVHQATVAATLTTKSNADTARKPPSELRSSGTGGELDQTLL